MPVVIVTPWISKFYILDLNPKKSLVRYLLDQRAGRVHHQLEEPGEDMRDVRFDDYLTEGIQSSGDTAQGVSSAAQVHRDRLLHRRHRVTHLHGLASITRWKMSAGGPLRTHMAQTLKPTSTSLAHYRGFVTRAASAISTEKHGKRRVTRWRAEMASAFVTRSNSLIWHYIVHGWLYEETPPPFDVLF